MGEVVSDGDYLAMCGCLEAADPEEWAFVLAYLEDLARRVDKRRSD
jgi:hypothetical protein